MIVDEQSYLMHYGIKGQKWGIRKQQATASDNSSKPKKPPLTREQKLKRVEIGLKVIGGALAVASILAKAHGNSKIRASNDPLKNPQLRKVIDDQNRVKRSRESEKWLRQNVFDKKIKVSDVRPPPAAKKKIAEMSPDTKKFLADFSAKQNVINTHANSDLKSLYEKGQVPLHAREYLDAWTIPEIQL